MLGSFCLCVCMCVSILSIYQSDKLHVCETLNVHYMNKFYKYFDNIPFSHVFIYIFISYIIHTFIYWNWETCIFELFAWNIKIYTGN